MPAARPHQETAPDAYRTNDYHELPATEKQIGYARVLAQRCGVVLPWEVQQSRKLLSSWIDEKQNEAELNRFASYPSSKQVAFAERIARHKRRLVPQECFRDRKMMSKWIDANR